MTAANAPRTGREAGVSLIELMISMALGLVLIATIGNAYLSARQAFWTQNALSRIQEGARYAFEFMAEDIRLAGYTGGTSVADRITQTEGSSATLQGGVADLRNLRYFPLVGYVQASPPGWVTPSTGDVLTVIHADLANEASLDGSVASQCTGTSTPCKLTTWPNPAPAVGDTFVVADYTRAAVFRATAVNSGSRTIAFDGLDLGPLSGDLDARKLYPLNGVTYYIADNPANEPALYRYRLATGQSEELVEGVESMQISYGVDVDNDRNVDAYWNAAQVTAGTAGALTMPAGSVSDYWHNVLAVRISLTMVSRQGEAATVAGGVLRKQFMNTIAVRNRL